MKTLTISDIKHDGRIREDYGDIEELAESILEYGLIHPITIDQNNTLIAGGRRLSALKEIASSKAVVIDHDQTITPIIQTGTLTEGVHFIRRHIPDFTTLTMMELEENVRRKNMSWLEQCIAVDRVHTLQRGEATARGEGWQMKHTGRLLNISNGNVGYCCMIANLIRNGDEEIINAEHITHALEILAKRAKDKGEAMLARATLKQIEAGDSPFAAAATNKEATVDEMMSDFNESSAVTVGNTIPLPGEPIVEGQVITIPVSQMLKLGDFHELVKSGNILPESADHIITDPPYGINMSNLSQQNTGMDDIERIADTHDAVDNISNFQSWLQTCYRILRDKGYCIWWCDMTHWEDLRLIAEDVGFKTQRWPLVWVKTHSCLNQAASYNFTKNIEVALVMRKGVATLTKPQSSCYWMGSSAPERKLFSGHPFVKPIELWQWLANAVALQGQTIADPFSGVGSSSLAFLQAGYKIKACEIDEKHYNAQLNMITEHYQEALGSNIKFS